MFLYSNWLRLPIDTRHKIADIFKIKKSGGTEVVSNEIVKDGYSVHDIDAAVTKEALQQYLGSTQENFQWLWEDMINKVEGKPLAHEETTATITAATEEQPLDIADEKEEIEMPLAPNLSTETTAVSGFVPPMGPTGPFVGAVPEVTPEEMKELTDRANDGLPGIPFEKVLEEHNKDPEFKKVFDEETKKLKKKSAKKHGKKSKEITN